MKYRVTSARADIPTHTIATFEVDGDENARRKFVEFKKDPNNDWDRLTLVRIDQEEKTTRIESRDELPSETKR